MSEDADMNTNTTPYEPATEQAPPPRRELVRPRAGRSIAGVATGLAAYLNMSVGWIRFGFLALTVLGGLGLFLYLLGWLMIRDESERDSIGERILRDIGAGPSWVAVVLIVLGAVVVLGTFPFADGSLVWAAILIGVGILLYRGDLGSRSSADRPQPPAPAGPSVTDRGADDDFGGELPPPPPAPTGPVPPATPPPPAEPPSMLGRITIGVGLLALGVLAFADNLTTLIDPQPRHYLALATVVLGLGLLVGAFVGRARWMILLGVFIVPPLLASPLAEVEWEGRFERSLAPVDLADFDASYRGSVGSFRFDLTEADWDGETVPLQVELGAGEIVVFVPEGVGITGSASVGMGSLTTPGGDFEAFAGLDRDFSVSGDRGTVDLDLSLGAGSIEVHVGDDPEVSDGEAWNLRFDQDRFEIEQWSR